ncbi:MAG: thioredoxin family protein [Deltaproteobacteria bacterium]|nr:thioredoxin family protein [Deltaproteobacteria bacterium]
MARAFDGAAAAPQTRVRAGLSYAYAYGDQPYGGTQAKTNFDHLSIRLQLVTLSAGIDFASGLGAGLLLPSGRIRSDSDSRHTDDFGIGDLELRARADVFRLLGLDARWLPKLQVNAGMAAPTGPYISKLQVTQLQPGQQLDKTLSLGRGTWWLLADAEVYGRFFEQLGWFAALRTRTPLADCEDGFRWERETVISGGLAGQVWPKRVQASVSLDWLQRKMPSELDWQGVRVDSASVGGEYLDLTASLRGQLTDQLALDLTGRKPLRRDVLGLQTPPAYWVFVGLSWSQPLGEAAKPQPQPAQPGDRPQPEIAALLQPGRVALVDYWATWCAPCQKLSAQLEEFAKAHPELLVVRVDASDWDAAQMQRLLPAVAGLPVVDVYGGDGSLRRRLVGAEAFDYAAALPELATATAP